MQVGFAVLHEVAALRCNLVQDYDYKHILADAMKVLFIELSSKSYSIAFGVVIIYSIIKR
jgi:hypothetical protein